MANESITSREMDIYLQGNNTISWRSFLNNAINSAANKFIEGTALLDAVDPAVTLPLTYIPGIDASYQTEEPLKNIVEDTKSGITKVIGQVSNILNPGSKDIAEDIAKTALNIGEAVYEGTSGKIFNPWWTSIPALGSGAVKRPEFSVSFDFAMGQFGLWSGLEEVVKPILNLSAPVLLRNLSDFTYTPPFPSAAMLVKEALSKIMDASKNEDSHEIVDLITKVYDDYTYTLVFGNFAVYSNMILTHATSTFSHKVDDQGYPISGRVELKFKSLIPYTAGASYDKLISVKYGGASDGQ